MGLLIKLPRKIPFVYLAKIVSLQHNLASVVVTCPQLSLELKDPFFWGWRTT